MRARVEAEIDEFDVARIHLGATVNVMAEGFDKGWQGTIEEIPDSVVNRRIKPQDPSKPIDTRVLLVKVAFAEPTKIVLISGSTSSAMPNVGWAGPSRAWTPAPCRPLSKGKGRIEALRRPLRSPGPDDVDQ